MSWPLDGVPWLLTFPPLLTQLRLGASRGTPQRCCKRFGSRSPGGLYPRAAVSCTSVCQAPAHREPPLPRALRGTAHPSAPLLCSAVPRPPPPALSGLCVPSAARLGGVGRCPQTALAAGSARTRPRGTGPRVTPLPNGPAAALRKPSLRSQGAGWEQGWLTHWRRVLRDGTPPEPGSAAEPAQRPLSRGCGCCSQPGAGMCCPDRHAPAAARRSRHTGPSTRAGRPAAAKHAPKPHSRKRTLSGLRPKTRYHLRGALIGQ